jgi:serine/threonine protein phosphatase PrpC
VPDIFRYLILACDGLWDVCTAAEAAEFVTRAFLTKTDPVEVAKELVAYAIRSESTDNVSVSIVVFDWPKPLMGAQQPLTVLPLFSEIITI